jgi:hypothetical protein
MAGRRFEVADVVEVLQHWQAGRSVRHLARSLGVGRDRVRVIIGAATAAGLSPGEPLLTRQEWEARVPLLFVDRLGPMATEQRQELARFHEAIVAGLATNTAQTVWQRLRDEQGLTVSIRTFRRYLRERIPGGVDPDQGTVRKEMTPPGEVAEIDYGRLGPWWPPHSSHDQFPGRASASRKHRRPAPEGACRGRSGPRCAAGGRPKGDAGFKRSGAGPL